MDSSSLDSDPSSASLPPLPKWQIHVDGQTYGPFSRIEIEAMAKEGRIDTLTQAYDTGAREWRRIESVRGLEGAFGKGSVGMQPALAPRQPSPYSVPDQSAPNGSDAPRFAGFWIRASAYLIDEFIMATVAVSIGATIGLVFLQGMTDDQLTRITPFLKIIGAVIGIAYFAVMHSGPWQATLGKRAVGIHLVRTDGVKVGLPLGIGRYFGLGISSVLTLGIGLFMAGWTREKRALHDMICSTRVVYGRL